ncbi:MAG: hypothetical protein QXM46_02840 [Candidatus Hadarchaeales archaeon]
MEGFGKMAAVGLASVASVIVFSTVTGVGLAMPVNDFKLTAGSINGQNLNMYVGTMENYGGKIFQELSSATISNLEIVKEMSIGGLTIKTIIQSPLASASGVLMKCDDFSAKSMSATNQRIGPYGGRDFAVTADTLYVENVSAWVTEMVVASLDLGDMVIKLET